MTVERTDSPAAEGLIDPESGRRQANQIGRAHV